MNSQNTKTDMLVSNEIVTLETDLSDKPLQPQECGDITELSIVDDYDEGGDPYNTTGQHVIVMPKYD